MDGGGYDTGLVVVVVLAAVPQNFANVDAKISRVPRIRWSGSLSRRSIDKVFDMLPTCRLSLSTYESLEHLASLSTSSCP